MEMSKSRKRKYVKCDSDIHLLPTENIESGTSKNSESIASVQRKLEVPDAQVDIVPDKKMILRKKVKAENKLKHSFDLPLENGNTERVTRSTALARKKNQNRPTNSRCPCEDNIETPFSHWSSDKTKDGVRTEGCIPVLSVNKRGRPRSKTKKTQLLAAKECTKPLQEIESISSSQSQEIQTLSETRGIPFKIKQIVKTEHSLPLLPTSSNIDTKNTARQCKIPLQKVTSSINCSNIMQNVIFPMSSTNNETNTGNRQSTNTVKNMTQKIKVSHNKLNENNATNITQVDNILKLKNQIIRKLEKKNLKLEDKFKKYKDVVQKVVVKEEEKQRLLQVQDEESMKKIKKLNDALTFKNGENEKLKEKSQDLKDMLNKYKNDVLELQKEKKENEKCLLKFNELFETLNLKTVENRKLREKNQELRNELNSYKNDVQKLQKEKEEEKKYLLDVAELHETLNSKNIENGKLREQNQELKDMLNKYNDDVLELQKEKEEQSEKYLLEVTKLHETLNLKNIENGKLREQNQELEDEFQKYKRDVEISQKEKEESQETSQSLNGEIENYDSHVNELSEKIKHLENQIQEEGNKLKKYSYCYEMVYGSNDMEDFGSLVLKALETRDWKRPSYKLKEIKFPYLVVGEFTKAVNISLRRDEHILVTAVKEDLKFFVGLFINAGFPVNYQFECRSNGTLLHIAAMEDNAVLENFLIKCGADINKRDDHGFTPLHKAVKYGHYEAARCLINNGADVHAQTEEGWTSLHLSAKKGTKALVQLLLYAGCSKNAKEIRAQTPYDVAKNCKRDKDLLLLLDPHNEYEDQN